MWKRRSRALAPVNLRPERATNARLAAIAALLALRGSATGQKGTSNGDPPLAG
jgi:hypothetical protein